MKEWWNRKKQKTRKHKKQDDRYTFWDFLVDVLFWIPELIILPFRMLYWMLRGLGRVFENIFDAF